MSESSTMCEQDTGYQNLNLKHLGKEKAQWISTQFLCAQELKSLSHLKEKLIPPPPKFIKPINRGQTTIIKTDHLASKNLAV